MSLQQLDGPSSQGTIPITNSVIVEVKVNASSLEERKVITLQPLGGKIRVYFADEGVTPSLSDVQNKGFRHFKNQLHSYEAGPLQKVYIVSESGSFDVVVAERA